jgi:NTP pyrophosphatase (non-canonical NTP hydrolase)
MEIREILKMQRKFDHEHGWGTEKTNLEERLKAIEKDLIGLVGEVGEAANCLKKVRLHLDAGRDAQKVYDVEAPHLREELIDAFIYLIRLIDLVEADLEKEYIAKLANNRERYSEFEKTDRRFSADQH